MAVLTQEMTRSAAAAGAPQLVFVMKVLPGLDQPDPSRRRDSPLLIQFVSAWRDTSWVEIFAAALAVAYVLLAIRQRIECWAAAFTSSCLYVWVLFGAHLYMESVLNAFYAVMAVIWVLAMAAGQGRGRSGGVPLADRAPLHGRAGHRRSIGGQFVFLAAIHAGRMAFAGFDGDLVAACLPPSWSRARCTRTGIGGW